MPLVVEDEDGPLEKIPLERFPRPRGNLRVFETLAAPVSRELDRHATEIGSVSSDMASRPQRDINSDFARTIPGAVAEISGQLGSLAEVDPGRMLSAMLEGLGEAEALAGDMAPSGASVTVPSGGSEFGVVQWAEAGSGSAPPSPHAPSTPAPPPSGSPDAGDPQQPPPEAPGAPPPSGPPPSEPPPDAPTDGSDQPPPDESEPPLF